jgi:hypothetical protein
MIVFDRDRGFDRRSRSKTNQKNFKQFMSFESNNNNHVADGVQKQASSAGGEFFFCFGVKYEKCFQINRRCRCKNVVIIAFSYSR